MALLSHTRHFQLSIFNFILMASRRRLARISAMQTVFEEQSRPVDRELSIVKNILECGGPEAVDESFAHQLVDGVAQKRDDIALAVQKHAPEWPLSRMDTLTRSILLIGAYELLFAADAPPAVVMNEAIDIAKEYGPAESPKFVNGVLNAIAQGRK